MKNVPTVQQLRKAGNKVRVMLFRRMNNETLVPLYQIKEANEMKNVSLFGGKVRVEITTVDGENVSGEALCHPLKDAFNRKLGTRIAIGRALSSLPI